MNKFHWILVTWFGSGLSKKAPGTMGSLATLPMIAAIAFGAPYFITMSGVVISIFFVVAIGIYFCAIPSVNWIIKHLNKEDPQLVVVDETVGQTMAFALIQPQLLIEKPWLFLVGFALFRLFDITKILGVARLENLPNAWGVLSDDLLAGVYAAILLNFIVKLIS